MEDYHFWKDFFDTYQSLPSWLQLVWALLPSALALAFYYIFLRYKIAKKRLEANALGGLVYSVHRGQDGWVFIQEFQYDAEVDRMLLPSKPQDRIMGPDPSTS